MVYNKEYFITKYEHSGIKFYDQGGDGVWKIIKFDFINYFSISIKNGSSFYTKRKKY